MSAHLDSPFSDIWAFPVHQIGGTLKRQSDSHRAALGKVGPMFLFAFYGRDEIGPRMLTRIAKRTGLNRDRPAPAFGLMIASIVSSSFLVPPAGFACER
jgi:hypothetical protein